MIIMQINTGETEPLAKNNLRIDGIACAYKHHQNKQSEYCKFTAEEEFVQNPHKLRHWQDSLHHPAQPFNAGDHCGI